MSLNLRNQNISKIEDRLYLGNIIGALSQVSLKQLDIRTVVTIMHMNIQNDKKAEGVTYHTIIANDYPNVDLLSHFHETNAWITYGQSEGHGVLVHCQAGMSRSATVTIAFLMNKYNKSFTETKQLVRSKRPIVSPNEGFEAQLLLYQKMNNTLDPNNRKFRKHLMECWLFQSLVTHPIDLYFERRDYCEGLTRVNVGVIYYCLKCNEILFKDINIIRNDSNERQLIQESQVNDRRVSVKTSQTSLENCGDIYIEPQVWMKKIREKLFKDNIIRCPTVQCQTKLGSVKTVLNKVFGQVFQSFQCQCPYHQNIRCLYLQINSKTIRFQ